MYSKTRGSRIWMPVNINGFGIWEFGIWDWFGETLTESFDLTVFDKDFGKFFKFRVFL